MPELRTRLHVEYTLFASRITRLVPEQWTDVHTEFTICLPPQARAEFRPTSFLTERNAILKLGIPFPPDRQEIVLPVCNYYTYPFNIYKDDPVAILRLEFPLCTPLVERTHLEYLENQAPSDDTSWPLSPP